MIFCIAELLWSKLTFIKWWNVNIQILFLALKLFYMEHYSFKYNKLQIYQKKQHYSKPKKECFSQNKQRNSWTRTNMFSLYEAKQLKAKMIKKRSGKVLFSVHCTFKGLIHSKKRNSFVFVFTFSLWAIYVLCKKASRFIDIRTDT